MDSIIVFLGLCAMVVANPQQLSPSELSLPRPFIISPQSHPIGSLWGSKQYVLNGQNIHPSIDMSHSLVPQHLDMYDISMEDQSDAHDYSLLPSVSMPNPLGNNLLQSYGSTQNYNSLGLHSSNAQTDPVLLQYQGSNLLHPEPNDKFISLLGYQDAGKRQLPSLWPSPYEFNQQHIPIKAREDKFVPDWSSVEVKIQGAINDLKINMVDPESKVAVPWWDSQAEYTLALGVILELMDQVSIYGPESYEDIFTGIVLSSLSEIRLSFTSIELAGELVEALMIVDSACANVRGYINILMHSDHCKSPSLCNEYIESVLKKTTSQRLQDEKMVLLAAANVANIFLESYAEELEVMAKQSMSYIYFGDLLSRGDLNELKPLVLAGAMLLKQVKEMNLEQP